MKGRKVNVRFTKEEYERIVQLAQENNRSFNEQFNFMIQQALDAYLKQEEERRKKIRFYSANGLIPAFPLLRSIKMGGMVSLPAYPLYICWQAGSGPRLEVLFSEFIFPIPSGDFSHELEKSPKEPVLRTAIPRLRSKLFFLISCALRCARKKQF